MTAPTVPKPHAETGASLTAEASDVKVAPLLGSYLAPTSIGPLAPLDLSTKARISVHRLLRLPEKLPSALCY